MITLNESILQRVFDKSFEEEACTLLGLLVDEELEKAESEIDFDFIDECSDLIISIQSGDAQAPQRFISMISNDKMLRSVSRASMRGITTAFRVALIAAVLLVSTLTVSAAIGELKVDNGKQKTTKAHISQTTTETITSQREKEALTKPKTSKKDITTKSATSTTKKSEGKVDSGSSTTTSSSHQILIDCTLKGVNGTAISYKRTGKYSSPILDSEIPKNEKCNFDEEAYKAENCVNLNTCIDDELHDFEEWRVTVKPSCAKLGRQVRACKRCGLRQKCPVRATGEHDIYGERIFTPAFNYNATEDGIIDYRCFECGLSEYSSISAPIYIVVDNNSFVYNSKVQRPRVIAVLDRSKLEIPPSYYTVSYSNKNSRECSSEYKLTIEFDNSKCKYYSSRSNITARYEIVK